MIRPARPGDLERLLDLWEALQDNGSRADVRYRPTDDARAHMRDYIRGSWFRQEPFPHTLVWEDTEVVGFVSGFARIAVPVVDLTPSVRIGDLFVAPSHRRQGVARALVTAFLERAATAGFPRSEVGTLTADPRAVAFWRAMGFGDWQVLLSRDGPPSDVRAAGTS